jgi:serine/threonine-protein kinase
MRCAACQTEIANAGRFCPECAAPLAPENAPEVNATETIAVRQKPPSSSSGSAADGRFPPGALLGERYRVVSMLGRGGMGEVYSASDLKLNQPVALKFLPAAVANKPGLLERFHGEVRIARQVSHPNVCRVYDIGDIEGSPFISMEYVDGEDLGGLLRRIGRLPGDKALEIARKLCAGLAAAHAKGVLHRDLKPANIMIDGRGQVLIMDFGLAALADQVAGAEVRNGTPAYMAPEQLAGKEVTERSDIYALGLVLYEIFTGQRAFKTADRSSIPSATSIVRDVDPVIERAIARCLDPDPAKRPPTAMALARMLPGGDPLAEALAAGDTPTPAMVAASDNTGALSVRGAVACMALVVVGLIGLLWMSGKSNILRLTPLPSSQEVLTRQARDIAARLGYTDPPVDAYHTFNYRIDYHDWAEKNLKTDQYREQVRRGQPSLIYFAYRQSPQYIEARDPTGVPSDGDPPLNVPGAVRLELDPEGRLTRFQAVPPQQDSGAAAPPMDWTKLFEAAGLDRSRWTETASQEIPSFGFDERKAWTGSYAGAPDMPMRIEAAAWKGRPVSFELFGPWRQPTRVQPRLAFQMRVQWTVNAAVSLVLLGAGWLAWRNYRAGRGDVRGALRLAAIGFITQSLGGMVAIHHVGTPLEASHWVDAVGYALYIAAIAAILYLALEPVLRRRWPQSLISWTRLFAGNARDPLAAGHILLGTVLAVALALLRNGAGWYQWQSRGILQLDPTRIQTLDAVSLARLVLAGLILPAELVLAFLFLFILFRGLLRNTWVAAAAVGGAYLAVFLSAPLLTPIDIAVNAVFISGLLWVMLRFGILPASLIVLIALLVGETPLTSDLSAWYASKGLFMLGLTLVLAIWSFRNALGGRKVLEGDFLDK